MISPKNLLILVLAAVGCWAQTNLSTPVQVLPPADASAGGALYFLDSTSLQLAGLRALTTIPTIVITSATAANPMVLTFATAPTVTAGSVITISAAAGVGCSGMNGPQTVTVAAGTSITISFNGIGCAYTASSGSASTAYWTLMGGDGTPGQAVVTDGAGHLGFGSAGVTSFDSLVGALTTTTTNAGVGGARLTLVPSGTVIAITLTQPGAWTPFTPTVTGLTSVTVNSYRYQQIGKTVFIRFNITGTGSGSIPTVSLPVAALDSNEWLSFQATQTGSFAGTFYFTMSGTTLTTYSSFGTTGTVYVISLVGLYESI
jgi:hypothetical protein